MAPIQDWTLHVGTIHTAWRERAAKTKRRLVFGHTHCLWPFDGLIADAGAFYEDKSWFQISRDEIKVLTL